MTYPWILGFLVGAAWSCANLYFIFRILRLALLKERLSRRSLIFLLTVKFPLLYIAGFAILSAKVYPIGGILAGFSAPLAGLCAVLLGRKFARPGARA